MNRKFAVLMISVNALVGLLVSATVSAELSVGVKEGDWIEYKETYAGTTPEVYITGFKIEVLSVQGTSITLNFTIKFSEGTQKTETTTVDLETDIGDGFIIPANLNVGDTVYDKVVGNITISGVEERIYADAKRTVVYTTFSGATTSFFYWDKTTGVLVEATMEDSPSIDYTFSIKADKTNIWKAQLFGLPIDPTGFFTLIIGTVVMVTAIAFFKTRKR